MGLRLNAISDTDARQELASYREQIGKWEQKGPSSDQRRVPAAAPRYYEKLSSLYFKAAMLAHQQQLSKHEQTTFFRRAGETAVEMFEKRGKPTASTNRNFYSLTERYLGCIAGFCDVEYRARLYAVHESHWHWPHDPKWTFTPGQREEPRATQAEYKLEYLRLAIETLATGRVNVPTVQALISELKQGRGSQDEREEADLCLWALMGLSDRNPGFLNQTLKRLVELHQSSAQLGHYRNMTEGLVATNALFIARMALERDIPINFYSDYLPVELFY